jgi:hypothetical protein
MSEITEGAAITYVRDDVKTYAAAALELYYNGKRLVNEWYGRNVGGIITTNFPCPVGDQALTGNEVSLVISRASEYVADLEASGNAKLNTLIQMRG